MASLPRPDLDTWTQRMRTARQHQQVWRDIARASEELYELQWHMDGIPDDVPITLPSTARAVVDEATDHSDFDPRWIRIHTPTYGLSVTAEETSSRLRSFFPGWLSYQISQANDTSPIRDFIKNLYLTGKGVYKVYFNKQEWPTLEVPAGTRQQDLRKLNTELDEHRKFVVPVVLRSINPVAVYEDPSLGEKRWAIEEYEHEAYEVLPMYENWQPVGEDMTRDDFLNSEHRLRIWDCYQVGEKDGVPGIWHQVFIDQGEPDSPIIAPADSGTPDPAFLPHEPFPYVIRFSGLGRQTGKYEEKARGILYAAMSLIKAEARRMTQLDAIISAMAWPTLFVTGPRNRFEVKYGPNIVNYIPPGSQATTVTPPIPAGPIQAALGAIQAGIERGTFGSVIRGDKPPQTTSAAQLAILSGQARLRFGSVKVHHEAALWDIFQKVCYIVKDVVSAPVTIWQVDDTNAETPGQLVLKPSDIPDRLAAHIEIVNDPDEERERRAQLGVFLFKEGIIDWEEAAERAGINDVAAMRRRMIRDKVLYETPAVMQALGEQFILESGYDIESLTLEKAMRDMLILRSQQDMQSAIMQSGAGGTNAPGNQPTAGMNVNPLGGAPTSPTPGQAQMRGEASAGGG